MYNAANWYGLAGVGLTIAAFAILNRMRGSRIYDLTSSTTVGRLAACLGMAMCTAVLNSTMHQVPVFLWSLASLMLADIFAWDNYWSAAVGNPTDIMKPAFAPVDWVMAKLPAMPLRLWGTVAMGLRMSLFGAYVAGLAVITDHPANAFYGLFTLLFGVPYLVSGYLWKQNPVASSEYLVGGLLGTLTALVCQ